MTMTPIAAACGNGVREATEMCDGNDLNGSSCTSLGHAGGGTLLCNKTTCMYDAIMCMSIAVTIGGAGNSGGAGSSGGAGTGN